MTNQLKSYLPLVFRPFVSFFYRDKVTLEKKIQRSFSTLYEKMDRSTVSFNQ